MPVIDEFDIIYQPAEHPGAAAFHGATLLGKGFGQTEADLRVVFVDRHGDRHPLSDVQLLSANMGLEALFLDCSEEDFLLEDGDLIVTVNNLASGATRLGPLPNHHQRDGMSDVAASSRPAAQSSPRSHQRDADRMATDDEAMDSDSAPEAERPARQGLYFSKATKALAVKTFLDAEAQGRPLLLKDVAEGIGASPATVSAWLRKVRPRTTKTTYLPEQRSAAVAAFRLAVAGGRTKIDAAADLGINYRTLFTWDREADTQPSAPARKSYSQAQKRAHRQYLSEALARGEALADVAEQLNLPENTLRNWQNRIVPLDAPCRFSEEDKATMIATARRGQRANQPEQEIADELKIHVRTLRDWLAQSAAAE